MLRHKLKSSGAARRQSNTFLSFRATHYALYRRACQSCVRNIPRSHRPGGATKNSLPNGGAPRTLMYMLWSTYLSGLVLGLGVCSLHCTLVLLPVTARLNTTWRGGVATAALFSLGKITVLTVYGGAAGVLGLLLYDLLNNAWISFFTGMAVAATGVWFLLYSGTCGCIARRGSPVLLGLADGAVPCAATTGFLLYLASQGGSIGHGLMNGLVFGLGTATGPLLLVCGVAPRIWRRFAGNRRALLVLRIVGSSVFFLWAGLILTTGGI